MRRRDFIALAAGGALPLLAPRAALPAASAAAPALGDGPAAFPAGFAWGVSTSAYQIEGAAGEDGRGPSIWDTFARAPGRVRNGDTGDVACDHYRRWPEDLDLMARAGIGHYRFSVAWPRVLPEGTGRVEPRGLDFYDRLVDGLLARGIEPWPCLFHWDFPQALQDRGGWLSRDAAGWFADYARVVARRLGDRVERWVMLNEPSVFAIFGHGLGGHAPGLTGRAAYAAAIHHQNLAQGDGLAAVRAEVPGRATLGTVLSVQPALPALGLDANRAAAEAWDAIWNRACLDPLFHGRYPEALARDMEPLLRPGDMGRIRRPVDFLGLNYYSRMHMAPDPGSPFGVGYGAAPAGTPATDLSWPVEPDGLLDQLRDLRDRYGNPPVYVTENGGSFLDADDRRRVLFMRDHLLAGLRALAEGCDLRGYLAWTLLDNFEWAEGYGPRFGMVAVEPGTLDRRPKPSWRWFSEAARTNAVPPA
jgi:beta-glucosidase